MNVHSRSLTTYKPPGASGQRNGPRCREKQNRQASQSEFYAYIAPLLHDYMRLPICDMFPSGLCFEICHRPFAVCRVERRRGGLRAELPGYALRALKRRDHQHTERTVCSVIRANMAKGVSPLLEKSIFRTPWCLLSCARVSPACHSFSLNTPSSRGCIWCVLCTTDRS